MTMARIDENNAVIEVGLPKRLQGTDIEDLRRRGWRQVKGTPKPERTREELRWVYGDPYTYNADEDAVYGTWIEKPIPAIRLEEKRQAASLSRADFKLGLLEMGELDAVKSVMADPETPERVVIMWEDSGRFERMHPDLLSFAEVMGYTDKQMDALFGIGTNEININTATTDELESLSGVGASLAQQIIDGRPWSSVNDLANISGISEDMVSSWSVTV